MSNQTFTPGPAPGSLFLDECPSNDFLLYPKLSSNPFPKHERISSINNQTPGGSRNSSLQKVWAEDYYNIDYSSEEEYTSGALERPTATLPFEGSVLAHEPSPPRPTRTHQRSLTSLLPFRTIAKTNSTSPERQRPTQEEEDFMATLTGDKEGVIKVADKTKGISSWFSGSSAPVPLGIPATEEVNMDTDRGKLQKRPESNLSTTTTPVKPTSRFGGLFSPKTPKQTTVQVPAGLNDEFLALDIETALFPAGRPAEQDPFSPAAFKNLLQNAEGLLSKLQNAYQLRTLSMHELTAEKEAVEEELEESRMKNSLLKANLSLIAGQVADRDTTIAELMNALTQEKQARAMEKEARERSLSMVKRTEQIGKRGSTSNLSIDTTGEDLGISNTTWKRQSTQTDFSTNSDAESSAGESTFSRARSPVNSMTGTIESHEILQASIGKFVPNPTHTSGFEKRPKMVQQPSTFQKVMNSMTSNDEVPASDLGMGEEGCSNCRGQTASVAWDTVGMMRAENKVFKERVLELEKAVDAASDACMWSYDQK